MWLRRLAWAAALTAALLFQITNENYLGRFLLALCVALPLLSLALSLPGMLRCRLTLSAVPAATARGGGQISSIVAQEAEGYFSGQKSAADVAALIQNRVSVYLVEQE